jgi:hypothetical protein
VEAQVDLLEGVLVLGFADGRLRVDGLQRYVVVGQWDEMRQGPTWLNFEELEA